MPDRSELRIIESLQQLSLSLGTTVDLDCETAVFMQWLARVIRPEFAVLFLVDESREHLEVVQTIGFEAKHDHLPLGLDPWQWLRRQGASLLPHGDPGCFAIPITMEGELLGLLVLVIRGSSVKMEVDVPLAEVAAGFLALQLRNIYRHSHVERLVEQRTAELGASEERFRTLFEESPVALFEVDLSRIKAKFDVLRSERVGALDQVLHSRPGFLSDLAKRVRLVRANEAALRLFGCTSKRELLTLARGAGMDILGEALREAFSRLYKGQRRFAQEVSILGCGGKTLHLAVHFSVLQSCEDTWKQALVSATDVTERLRAQRELERSYARLQSVLEGGVRSLAALIERRDPYTAGHQERVAELVSGIAVEFGLSDDRIQGLRVAAFLHDVGKIAVPIEILSKPGELSELEFALIKTHPQVGYEVLSRIDFPWPVAEIVRQHHERLDGSGYPQGLKGDEILLEAHILAVADVVDAMASHRPYRPAHAIEDALEEMRNGRGVLYHPGVAEACIRLLSGKGKERVEVLLRREE